MASKKRAAPKPDRATRRESRRASSGKGFHRTEGLKVPATPDNPNAAARAHGKAATAQRLTGRQEDALRLQLGVRMRSEDGHAVHLRVRFIKCGKPNCPSCPHGLYAYERWRGDDGLTHERYLGRAEVG